MKGSLRQRSKKSWTLTAELPRDSGSGKRRQLYETSKGTKRQAQERLAVVIASVRDGYQLRPERATVGPALGQWLQDHQAHVRARTWEGYANKARAHRSLGHIDRR